MTEVHRYDIDAVRASFPALAAGSAHFDGPGGTQVPQQVIDAIAKALSEPLCNRGAHTVAERNAEAVVVEARRAFGDFFGADPAGVVFGRSSTQLAYDFSRTLAQGWNPGDEVVVTRLDHESNVSPWVQAAARAGAVVRFAGFDPESGELRPEHIQDALSDRTRLVAVTAASNLIGTRPDIPAIARLVHDAGAVLFVDGAQYAAHASMDFTSMGADFLTCSAYKFLGPHLGVLVASPDRLEGLDPDKLSASTNSVPERFELGILPYGVLAGARAAVDFWAQLSPRGTGTRRDRLVDALSAVESYEEALLQTVEGGLKSLDGVNVWSRATVRTPTLLVTFDGHDAHDVRDHLATRGVDAGAGTFYAREASRVIGLGDRGGLRLGLAPYTSIEDVDRLLVALHEYLR